MQDDPSQLTKNPNEIEGGRKLGNPFCPVFYSLMKTQELSTDDLQYMSAGTHKIRPVIRGLREPTDRMSLFFSTALCVNY